MGNRTLLAAVAIGLAAPLTALAADTRDARSTAVSPHDGMPLYTETIHSGAANPDDRRLADRIAAAYAADPQMHGATVTIVANNGGVALSGSSKDIAQSARAERLARHVAGTFNVSGTLDPLGG